MGDPTEIGSQFLTAFYQSFDTNRAALAPLYVSVESQPQFVHGCTKGECALPLFEPYFFVFRLQTLNLHTKGSYAQEEMPYFRNLR